jgi:hypothetical protein
LFFSLDLNEQNLLLVEKVGREEAKRVGVEEHAHHDEQTGVDLFV